MLAKRNVRILKRLLQEHDYLSISLLSRDLNITARAIRYDIELIDQFLVEQQMKKIARTPNKGIRLDLSEQERTKLKTSLDQEQKERYIFHKDERILYLLNCILCEDALLHLPKIAVHLDVSISTINKDIVSLKKTFERYDLKIEYNIKEYYKIFGEEQNIRNMLSTFYLKILYEDFVFKNRTLYVCNKQTMMDATLVCKLTDILESFEETYHFQLTDDSLLYMISHLYIMYMRLLNAHEIKEFSKEIKKFIQSSNLYEAVVEWNKKNNLIESYTLAENEICYLTQYLLGARVLSKDENEDDKNVYFMVVVDSFIQEVSKLLKHDFTKDALLYQNLLHHFLPMFNRIMLNTPIDNPLLDKIMLQFPQLFHAVKNASNIISEFCGTCVSDEELGYLCMHFGMIMNSATTKHVQKKKVIIVCPSGYATSMMIGTALETNYYVEVVKILPLRFIEKEIPNLEYDYLVSSVNLNQYPFDYIKVNPILSFEDILKLNQIFVERLQMKNATLDTILEIIKRNCIIQKEEELEEELSSLLNLKKNIKRKAEKMLIDVINENLIELNVEVSDWKDAIRKGGQLLVNEHVVKDTYVEAMIQSAINIGPYIVLEKGIALPHATPQDNTYKIGVSLITLKTPVEFGHEENDPVEIVICLASIDSKSHMQVLADIGKIFDEEDLANNIKSAKNKLEVLEILKGISQHK